MAHISQKNRPSRFFKYMTASTAKVVISKMTLRWSAPKLFNDYAEIQRMPTFRPSLTHSLEKLFSVVTSIVYKHQDKRIDLANLTDPVKELIEAGRSAAARRGATKHEVKAAVSNRFKNPHLIEDTYDRMIREKIDSYASRLRILCLTTKATNARMWAHYGERHNGCALEFRSGAIADCFFKEAKRIRYTNDLTAGSGLEILLYGGTDKQLEMSKENIFYAKTTDWSYEDEWRLQSLLSEPSPVEHTDYVYRPQQLAGIYFGLHCPVEFQSDLLANLPSALKGVPVYKMEQVKGVLQPRALT